MMNICCHNPMVKNIVLTALIVSLIGGSEAFGIDIHHRYSETVKGFLDLNGLPEKDSLEYFAAMAHRDQFFKTRHLRRRNLAETDPSLTFSSGNATYQLKSLGFLHYAVVGVGTPKVSFIVALDTGSDLFWLPCECTRCARSLNSTDGSILLNQYSLNASSTSEAVPCNSPSCGQNRGCLLRLNACAYQEIYLSSNTSSTGILVDDVLHMATADSARSPVQAPITLGCGIIQTGDFLETAAPNGLFGLGMDNVSVPSILARKGIASNSFSMCFSPDGLGRLEFGDKGSSDQKTTPFNLEQLHPTYNVTVTQLTIGKEVIDLEFSAIFDTGTSFTYLNDPAYSAIADNFHSQITEPRYIPATKIIFEYCYQLSATQKSYVYPRLNLTMQGGDSFHIIKPTIVIPTREGGSAFCLAMVKSEDINIIGQNFMSGYRLAFDREDMVLGWKESNCYDSGSNGSPTVPVNNGSSPSPPSIFEPQATPNRTRSFLSPLPPPPPPPPLPRSLFGNAAPSSSSFMDKLLLAIFSLVFHHLLILS